MKSYEPDPGLQLVGENGCRRLDIAITNLLNQFGRSSDDYGVGLALSFRSQITEYSKTADEYTDHEVEVHVWNMVHDTGSFASGSYVQIWTNLTPAYTVYGQKPTLYAWRLQAAAVLVNGEFYERDEYGFFDEYGKPFDLWLDGDKRLPKEQRRDRDKQHDAFQALLEPEFMQADYSEIMGILASFDPTKVIES